MRIYLSGVLFIALLLLLPSPYKSARIIFKEGTTTEQVAQLLQGRIPEGYQYPYQAGYTMGVASSETLVSFDTNDWKAETNRVAPQLWESEKDFPQQLRSSFNKSLQPNSVKQMQDNDLFHAWLQETVVDCWLTSSCPALQTNHYEAVMTQSNLNQIKASPIIEKIESQQSVFFWLTTILHRAV